MSISMFVSLKNSFVMITNLSEHHFRHKIYSVGVKLRSDLDELWQQMKAQADENHGDEWDITDMRDIYIDSDLDTVTIWMQQEKNRVGRYPPTEHLLDNYEEHPYQHKNNQNMSFEKEHSPLSLKETP